MASAPSSGCHTSTPFGISIRNSVTRNVRCNQLLQRRAKGRCRRDGLGGYPCSRRGMVLVDARGGGTNRRAMGREIRQKAGRAGCAPCNAETGCCRVACRRTVHGRARSDRFRPVCCQTLGRTDRRCRPHTLGCSRSTQSRLSSLDCARPQSSPVAQEPRSLSPPPCHPTGRSPSVRPWPPPAARQRPGRPHPRSDDVPSR